MHNSSFPVSGQPPPIPIHPEWPDDKSPVCTEKHLKPASCADDWRTSNAVSSSRINEHGRGPRRRDRRKRKPKTKERKIVNTAHLVSADSAAQGPTVLTFLLKDSCSARLPSSWLTHTRARTTHCWEDNDAT